MSEAGPNRSARVLGFLHGLTAMEMNILLKEEGFLEGEPGQYIVTEKGQKYADEQHHHRGTGGYAWYNRHWEQRTWDPSLTGEFDVTEERGQRLRGEASAARRRAVEKRAVEASGFESVDLENGEASESGLNPRFVLGGVVVLSLSAYGVWKLAPHAKSAWTTRAAPSLKRLRSRVLGKDATERPPLADPTDIEEDPSD